MPYRITEIAATLIKCKSILVSHPTKNIDPILVRRNKDYYEIIDGERRYNVALLAGRVTIPCYVVNWSDEEVKYYLQMQSFIAKVKNGLNNL